ncbi:MAG: N-acetylglucosamine-6-phosphate deacetylase [Burkholderiales bacterium]|nr:N-acetylglucosamine-6-phosphate deacetylase [Burkholderiales bacterium]
MKLITAKYIFDGFDLLEGKALELVNGNVRRIVDLTEDPNCINLGNGVVTPGLVDLQLNGCGGVLFNADISSNTLEVMYKTCLRFGTSSFLPTLITCDVPSIKKALTVVYEWVLKHGLNRGVIGIHLEGPFISKEKHGIHNQEYILQPQDELLDYIISYANQFPIKMTIAPEMFHVKQLKRLNEAGIILSVGHSNASYQVTKNAIDNGINTATHVFNAMSGLSGRNPGVVGAVLNNDIYVGVIADLLHVNASNIELLYKIKGDKLYLVTDAVTPMGTTLKEFDLVGNHIYVKNGKCVDVNGTLGGANITMNECVRNCLEQCNIPLQSVLRMASTTPLKVMGLYDSHRKLQNESLDNWIFMELDNYQCTFITNWDSYKK